MTSPGSPATLQAIKPRPVNCQSCGIESNMYQKLRWKEASLEGENAILRSQLWQQGHVNQSNFVNTQQALVDHQRALDSRDTHQRLAAEAFLRESNAHKDTKLSLKHERGRFIRLMRFVDTLPFVRADPSEGAMVSTLWQARNQRRDSDVERSDQGSQKVDLEIASNSPSDSSTSDGQSPKRKRVGLLRPV